MTTSPIRIGVIGAGANTTSKHIPNLQAIEGVAIVGVCNRSRASGERVAAQFNIPQVYESWPALINSADIDAIVIGTWPYMHCRLTLAALAADKHVMCEARMAMDANEAHLMRDAAREKPHLVAQIVPSPFTLRVDKTIKRLLAEGYLGELLAVEVRAGGPFLDKNAPLHWRNDFDLSGYNIMTMGIWYEALLRWVGAATSVVAMGKTYVKMRKNEEGILKPVRIPEHIDVMADLACGAQMHLQVSTIAGLTGAPEAYLFGSEGTLRFTDNKLFGGKKGDKALAEIAIPAAEAGAWRVEEEFINAIRGQEEITHTNFEDGVKYMEFTEAVTRSMQEGRVIALPL
ncbi:MAG: gfo/Idh/MocA family oxidoreductase [Caldilinea sp. CFX5]|nr:gfo/Idh/MocA family oxidoreductase [Caldilinea sp. CFX5]